MENSPERPIGKIILAVFLFIFLTVGAFFAYQQFFKTKSQQVHFFPPEFEKYAVGEDASAFIILKNDDKVRNLVKEFGAPLEYQNLADTFENALLVSKKDDLKESTQITIQFKSAKDAESAKIFVESESSDPLVEVITEDNFLIMSNKSSGDFKGSFYDNPKLAEVNDEIVEEQFVFYGDSQENSEANILTLLGFVSSYSVNLELMNLTENNKITLNVDETSINFRAEVTFNDENNSLISEMEQLISLIENKFKSTPIYKEIEGIDIDASFENMTFVLEVKVPVKPLIETFQKTLTAAPGKARDAQRIASIQKLQTVIVNYYLENNFYPSDSQCVEEIKEIEQDFTDGVPSDPLGPQSFGEITCESGYYYQIIPEEGFLLWTKVEDKQNGNTNKTPDQITTMEDDLDFIIGDGEFYVVRSSY